MNSYPYRYPYEHACYLTILMSVIQMCSGITRGGVLNGELYAQGFHKLFYLHLLPDSFS